MKLHSDVPCVASGTRGSLELVALTVLGMRAPDDNTQMLWATLRREGEIAPNPPHSGAECSLRVAKERRHMTLCCLETISKVALEMPGLEMLREFKAGPGITDT